MTPPEVQFLAFSLAVVLVAAITSILLVFISLPFLLFTAPRQVIYAMCGELTGEKTTTYVDVTFSISYPLILSIYSFVYALSSLPYVWFVIYSADLPMYWIAAYPVFASGVTIYFVSWFSRVKQLRWTETNSFFNRFILTTYVLAVDVTVIGTSYYAGYRLLQETALLLLV